jgi:hypothetical protein
MAKHYIWLNGGNYFLYLYIFNMQITNGMRQIAWNNVVFNFFGAAKYLKIFVRKDIV